MERRVEKKRGQEGEERGKGRGLSVAYSEYFLVP